MGEKISGLIGLPMQHMAHNAAHLEGHKNGLLTNLVGWLGDSASCRDNVMHNIIEDECGDENTNTVMLLDDIIRSIKNKNSEELTKAILNRRHCTQNNDDEGQAGLSIILTSQVYNYLFLGLRKNASHLTLFRTENQKEKNCIKQELMGDLNDKQADAVMDLAWNGKHHFLLMCAEKPTRERYYKNCDSIQI